MYTPLRRLSGGVDRLVQPMAIVILTGMTIAIALQILFRVLFDALPWTEEVSRYLLVWVTFLGAILAYGRGVHIAVTFVVNAFPKVFQDGLKVVAVIGALVFFAVGLIFSIRYMGTQSAQVSASLRMPMPAVYSVMPVSFAILILHGVTHLLSIVQGKDDEEAAS